MSVPNPNNPSERPPNAIPDYAHMTKADVLRLREAIHKLHASDAVPDEDEIVRRTAIRVLFERIRRLSAPVEDLALLNGVSRREYVEILDSCLHFAEEVWA